MTSAFGVFQESFDIVVKNYFKFLALFVLIMLFFMVIVGAILAMLLVFSPGLSTVSTIPLALAVFIIIIFALIFLVEPIWIGAYYSMALQGLKGKVSVTYAIRQARKKYIPLLWTFAIESLILIAVDIVIFLPALLALPGLLSSVAAGNSPYSFGGHGVSFAGVGTGFASSSSGFAILSFFGLALLLVIIYMVVTALVAPLLFEAVPLVMLENTKGIKAIERSVDIGRKQFWSILGLVVLSIAVFAMIGFAEGLIEGVIAALNTIAGSLLYIILAVLLGSFLGAWSGILPVIFYRDYLDSKKSRRK